MTIGIIMCTFEHVLLIADGRRSTGMGIVTDEAQKIVNLRDSLSLIEIGAEIASQAAIRNLQAINPLPSIGEEIYQRVEESVTGAGYYLRNIVDPASANMDRIKVALAFGGIDATGTYIGGSLFGAQMDKPSSVLNRASSETPFAYSVIGGEIVDSNSYFREQATIALQTPFLNQGHRIQMLLNAALMTVRRAEKADSTIGGQVSYQVLTSRHSPISGKL